MTLFQTLKNESVHIIKNRFKVVALLLFFGATLYSVWQGYLIYKYRAEQILLVQKSARESQQEVLGWFKNGKSGPEERPWIDVKNPFWAMWYGSHYVIYENHPLMILSPGQVSDIGIYKKVSVWSTPFDQDLIPELSNAEFQVSGFFDFSFVWLFLLPLLLIILMYNIQSFEKDAGLLLLVNIQAGKTNSWWLKRVLVIGITLSLWLIVVVIVPRILIVKSFLFNKEWIEYLFFSMIYLWGWLGLYILILSRNSSQVSQAIQMITIWIFLVLVIPASVQQWIQMRNPASLMTEWQEVEEKRDSIYAISYDSAKTKLLSEYKDLGTTKIAKLDSISDPVLKGAAYRSLYKMYIDSSSEVFLQSIERKNQAFQAYAFINPVMWFQNRLNHLSNSDLSAIIEIRRRIRSKSNSINKRLIFDEWNEVVVDSIQFKKYLEL